MNAVCAVEAAKADHSETVVCMHADESDDYCALHRGTRVRKNHTSRRDAFETVGAEPLGEVEWKDGDGEAGEVSFNREPAARGADDLHLTADLERDVQHIKFVPGAPVEFLDVAEDASGLVIEGTGLGHVTNEWIPRIEELIEDGTTVVMTSQCLEGRVCDRVYDTGRDLLDAGVVEAGDTLPETAYVKLMWALANVESVEETMRRSVAGELQERSVPWT
jgi:glutamyl-tRNA(Gln) amidotransferase subunit D